MSAPIIITVQGGVVQSVENIPAGIVVEVRDFDTEGCDSTDLEEFDGALAVVTRHRG